MLLWTLVVGLVLILWLYKLNKVYCVLAFFAKRIRTADGSTVDEKTILLPSHTIFGNTFDLIGLDDVGVFRYGRECAAKMKRSYLQYICGLTVYNIICVEDVEVIYNDPKLLTKGYAYDYLFPAIGEGLLISNDKKWHSRRKMLTLAFHFNILNQFVEIFKEESRKFVDNLEKQNSDVISVSELVPKFTLNSVCETTLGVKLDECLNGDEYRDHFKVIEKCFNERMANPLLMIGFIYKLFQEPKYRPSLKAIHDFSSNIIETHRKQLEELQEETSESTAEQDLCSSKKRYALLDTLLRAEKDGLIDHAGICEEVDTFVFEGYDTTSMGLIFGLMNLSLYPEMQEKCYEEIQANLGDDLTNLNASQLNSLKYLECFLKESLRLYPPVPIIGRKTTHEIKFADGLLLPPHTHIAIHIFDIQRDAKHFKNPEVFDPERFSPENCASRHPYAFCPFSAGQRNCIGQKFAMLEMKILMVHVIKRFKLLPLVDPKEFAFQTGIIIRTKNNIRVRLVKRE